MLSILWRLRVAVMTLPLWVLLASPGRAANPRGVDSIQSTQILEHTRVLASDEFEGRGPGTPGEVKTVGYLVQQFRRAGLQPGMPDGSWTQDVPIVGVKSSVGFTLGGEALVGPQDYVAWSPRLGGDMAVPESDVLFMGYGIHAPEYGWNDFRDVDVRGKTIVVLINDPPIPDPANPDQLDPKWFGGKAMTYYGRWTYKFEEAGRRGAAAVLIIHETAPAAYPWFVVINSWGRERFDLESNDSPRSDIAGWMSLERAQKLFAANGTTYEAMKEAARKPGFRPVTLKQKAAFTAHNESRSLKSKNVLGMVRGRDPKLRDEWVVVTAHWDHFGVGVPVKGDSIYNGAADNATGTAGLLTLAKAFMAMPVKPKRTILFLAVTAEEQGLLGAAYYAAVPVYPLAQTVANINMDMLSLWGPTSDLVVIGLGNSELDDYAQAIATAQQRTLTPDAEPEKGFYYRSDHFHFAKQGVPAFYAEPGVDVIGRGAGYGRRKRDEYTANDYHAPQDEIKPDWDLSGAVQDLHLLLTMGYRVGNANTGPEWRVGNEFRAVREAMLKRPKP